MGKQDTAVGGGQFAGEQVAGIGIGNGNWTLVAIESLGIHGVGLDPEFVFDDALNGVGTGIQFIRPRGIAEPSGAGSKAPIAGVGVTLNLDSGDRANCWIAVGMVQGIETVLPDLMRDFASALVIGAVFDQAIAIEIAIIATPGKGSLGIAAKFIEEGLMPVQSTVSAKTQSQSGVASIEP